jgi:hypothetical protein
MRRVIVVAMLVAAVAALLPAAVGLYLQQRWDRLLEHVAARGYRLTAREYQLGWARSEARVEVAPPADADDEPTRLGIGLRLDHGYARWLGGGSPRLAAFSGRATVLGGPRPLPPLVVGGTLGLLGGLDGTLRVPDVTYSGAVGQLHFVAGSGVFRRGPDGRLQVSGSLDALEAEAPDGRKLRLEGLGFALRLADAQASLPLGELSVTLGALSLDASAAQPALALGELEAALATALDGAAAAIRVDASVAALTLGSHTYAPSGGELLVEGLRAPALVGLRARLAALDAAALAPSQRGAALAQIATAALPELLGGEPRLRLRALRITTPYGELAADADLGLAPPSAPAGGAEGQISAGGEPLSALTARLTGTAEVSGPQALVVALITGEQTRRVRAELALRGEPADHLSPALAADLDAAAQASAQRLLREGWLVAEQGRLLARLSLERGTLELNGKAIAVADWLAPGAPPGAP